VAQSESMAGIRPILVLTRYGANPRGFGRTRLGGSGLSPRSIASSIQPE